MTSGRIIYARPANALPKEVSIVFQPASVRPSRNEPWEECAALLLNPCDGYHNVVARFDGDGEFAGFYDFAGREPYEDDFYVAWALLPDELPLIWTFDPKRSQGALAAASTTPLLEGRTSQHVLKAKGASPDATDRETCANASPDGGPMGAGQAAAAAPAGGGRDNEGRS